MDQQDDDLLFKKDELIAVPKEQWQILIVDEDEDIHDVTKFVLKDFEFRNKKLHFISAFSLPEAKKIVDDNPDIALILLDIVMEEEDSGLKFVKYLRETLKNQIVRIILRTGHPGVAPRTKVVVDYDINDYKEKTDLTKENLFYTIVMALRSFEILQSLQLSLNFFESSYQSAERFISKDYLAILNKASIADIKVGDFVQREMTALFVDISPILNDNENASTKENLKVINNQVNILDQVVQKYNGFINYFIGYTLIALFDGSINNAIKASLSFCETLSSSKQNQHTTIRVGIKSGPLTLGIIGSEDKMNYIILGDTIQVADQLLKNNKYYHTHILVGQAEYPSPILSATTPYIRWIGKLSDNNHEQQQPIFIYEIFSVDDETTKELKQQTKSLFENAVNDYIECRFGEAKKKFTEVLNLNPEDQVVKKYLSLLVNK